MRYASICALALALAAPLAGHAATEAWRSNVIGVRYNDLDLNRQGDAAAMLHRLDQAAMEACGAQSYSVPDYRWAVRRSSCYDASLGRAVAELNAPAVTALYQQQGYAQQQSGPVPSAD